ncbi:hypothetical protein K435DRAFT_860643 [Dendrothele bispora CBS 962.96]|uniref:Uncharacterized protein n=1 Tax=Dendrothele bispora (strain CBS 962.96) TaxID=1314807 RepID=A0A4S8LXE0_DENBC|nr:hypothetical protein K435DRAFT_860643 [Dendrothele bispora CBS 962.96]
MTGTYVLILTILFPLKDNSTGRRARHSQAYPTGRSRVGPFYHLLGWIVLRYTLRDDFTGAALSQYLIETYDWSPPSRASSVIPSGKRRHMAIKFFQGFNLLEILPLRKLLAVLEQHCWARYEPDELEEEDEDEALSIQLRLDLEQRRRRIINRKAHLLQAYIVL